jgi:hypothetical protein
MLTRSKNLNSLCASLGQRLQQPGVQPLTQKYMGRNYSEHALLSSHRA